MRRRPRTTENQHAYRRLGAVQSNERTGLIPIDALAKGRQNQLIEDGVYPGLEQAIEESTRETAAEEAPTEEEKLAMTLKAGLPAKGNVVPIKKADAAPRTLYVRRQLLNGDDVRAWAKGQGFKTTLPPSDMHVTIAFSRQPIDWMKVGESWSSGDSKGNLTVAPGGPRLVEKLGPSAVVLLFNSTDLAWRHMSIREAGASWDHPEYQPHITLSYAGAPEDLSTIEPYRGELRFGPEIFEEVNEDWKGGVTEE